MKYDYSDVCDMLEQCEQKYGKIDEDELTYTFDEEEISEAKWDLLSKEQQDALSEWRTNGGDEEEWYLKNAPEIWKRIEEEAGKEEDEAWRLIERAERIAEFVESDDELFRKEYYRDRI